MVMDGTVWVIEEGEVRVKDWRVVLLLVAVYSSKMLIIEKNIDVEGKVGDLFP